MNIENATEFIFRPLDGQTKLYISKDLQKLIDMNNHRLVGIYAVFKIGYTDILMAMCWNKCGEPIVMSKFVDKLFFMHFYQSWDVVNL